MALKTEGKRQKHFKDREKKQKYIGPEGSAYSFQKSGRGEICSNLIRTQEDSNYIYTIMRFFRQTTQELLNIMATPLTGLLTFS